MHHQEDGFHDHAPGSLPGRGGGATDRLRALLTEDASLANARSPEGTLLHWAAMHGCNARTAAQAATGAMLLGRGARVDARSRWGATPLHLVSGVLGRGRRPSEVPAAEALLTAGADINTKDNDGLTPLTYAEYWGAEGVAALLRANGGTLR